jgi:hypothetical protein
VTPESLVSGCVDGVGPGGLSYSITHSCSTHNVYCSPTDLLGHS